MNSHIQSQLPVDDAGAVVGYIDSGVPTTNSDSYTTIFALHGWLFGAETFSRVMTIAPSHGIRFVAVCQRGYHSSTAIDKEIDAEVTNGTDEQKAKFINDRGVELARFISAFIDKNALPPLSEDKKSGGFALLSWSNGALFAIALLSAWDTIPKHIGEKLRNNLNAAILFDTAILAIGMEMNDKMWSLNAAAPPNKQVEAFIFSGGWYFDHGDLETRDPDVISYFVPSLDKVPSCFNITAEERARIIDAHGLSTDFAQAYVMQPQKHASYMKAFYDKSTRQFWKNMEISVTYAEKGACFTILATWGIEKDNMARGGEFVNVVPHIPGANHLMHWDEPERFLKVHTELIKKHK